MQALTDEQETASRNPFDTDGVGSIDQLNPSQRSINGRETVSPRFDEDPTATHAVVEVHATPSSSVDGDPATATGGEADQRKPSHKSATALIGERGLTPRFAPTATQKPSIGHDSPNRCAPAGRSVCNFHAEAPAQEAPARKTIATASTTATPRNPRATPTRLHPDGPIFHHLPPHIQAAEAAASSPADQKSTRAARPVLTTNRGRSGRPPAQIPACALTLLPLGVPWHAEQKRARCVRVGDDAAAVRSRFGPTFTLGFTVLGKRGCVGRARGRAQVPMWSSASDEPRGVLPLGRLLRKLRSRVPVDGKSNPIGAGAPVIVGLWPLVS